MKWIALSIMLMLIVIPHTLAVDFDQDISDEDKETFDEILEPVMKVYSFVKYAATVLAVLYLIFAGISFIVNGKDQAKRESSKQMMIYVVLGLIVIWIAPLVVGFFVG